MQHLVILLSVAILAMGCSESGNSEETKAELDERLGTSTIVYHGGCDQVSACAMESRVCAGVGESLPADLVAGESAVLEWEAPGAVVGVRTYYYFIEADGSGEYYHEKRTDIAGSDCGDYCGWHRESFSSGELFDGSALHLSPSGNEIQDLEVCGWP